MKRGKLMTLIGSIVLIIGAFLPWISVASLFGKTGPAYEGIAIGWEGDGVITGGIGLLLLLGAMLFKGSSGKKYAILRVVLALVVGAVVFLDFLRIAELQPESGIIAATGFGLYVTLLGALFAVIGGLQNLSTRNHMSDLWRMY